MATYNSNWQQAQEDRLKKLTTYPSASVVQQEYRVAVFTVTFTNGAGADTLVLGKLGVAKHRVVTDRIKVYGGDSWPDTDLGLTLKRAPVTVGTDETTLGTAALDGETNVVTLAQAAPAEMQGQGGKDDIYYLDSNRTGGASAGVGATLTFEVPYYFEGP